MFRKPYPHSYSLHSKIILILLFFVLTPISLFTSFVTLSTFGIKEDVDVLGSSVEKTPSGIQVYASLPSLYPTVNGLVVENDARAEIIRQYLDYYNSPLEPYAKDIVRISDRYDIDFRLTTAIAQQESNLCKKIPAQSNNCWGWGIHSKGTLGFESFVHGVEVVSRGIRNDYVDEGLYSVEEIMSKWVPHSPEGAWAKGVEKFMDQMQ